MITNRRSNPVSTRFFEMSQCHTYLTIPKFQYEHSIFAVSRCHIQTRWSPTGAQIQLARDFSRCHSVTYLTIPEFQYEHSIFAVSRCHIQTRWSPTGAQIQLGRDFSRCYSVTPIWPSLSFNMNIRFLPCHGVTYRPDDHQQALKSS